jgi:hypothetical protein
LQLRDTWPGWNGYDQLIHRRAPASSLERRPSWVRPLVAQPEPS